jgi:3-oxoadipate enol-lactonase
LKIEIAHVALSADISGSGPPIVLLHSLLSDKGSFDRIIGPLARDSRVIVLDLPGFGESSPIAGGLDEIADRVAVAVEELARGHKPIILGNGFGGFIALQVAISHPGIASRLVLADCGAAFTEPGRQAFRAMAAAAAEKGLGAIVETAMRRLFSVAFQMQNPALMADRQAAFLRTDAATFQTACHALARLDLRGELNRVAIPVLVLVGENDEATPPPMSVELAALLPDSRLVILPGCAHVPQLQDPEAFLEAIADFIR